MRFASLLLVAAVSGCTEDPTPDQTDGSTTGSTTDGASDSDSGEGSSPEGSTSGPTPGTDESTDGPDPDDGSDSSTGEPVPEPTVHWVGRWDDADPTAMRMGWSGGGVVLRFDGTGASITMDDEARYFTVVVDGEVQPTLATTEGEQDYVLAADLPSGEHTVELYRRTEGNFGPSVVHGVTVDGELLPPLPVERRMEVIGDSITAGYGNEGESPCSFSAETENHYRTYGAFAARAVGAELHAIAWSGKGIIYNYGDDVTEPMPEVYDRTLASEGAPWSFVWQPDVVVINLGTNDFSTDNDPTEEQFVGAYVAFLEHLRSVYPEAFVLVVAPSLFGAEATMVEGYLMDVVAQRQAAGDAEIAFADINVPWIGSGCDGHPTVETHEGMGQQLAQQLQMHLGW